MIPGIPYDAEVEYLESTGTQWIDTGIALSSNCRVVCDWTALGVSSGSSAYAFGAYGDGINFGVNIDVIDGGKQYCVWKSSSSLVGNGGVGTRHVVDLSASGLFFDGVKIFSPSGSFTSNKSAYLFWANGTGQGKSLARIYRVEFYDANGTLVRDFIPVRFTNELGVSEGAMYDRVTKRLFRNQGTGSFVVGPDVAKPVMGLHFMKPHYVAKDYVQDGLVAMWDGIENAGWGVHNPATRSLVDLRGNPDFEMFVAESVELGDDYVRIPSGYSGTFPIKTNTTQSLSDVTKTVEFCVTDFSGLGSVSDTTIYELGYTNRVSFSYGASYAILTGTDSSSRAVFKGIASGKQDGVYTFVYPESIAVCTAIYKDAVRVDNTTNRLIPSPSLGGGVMKIGSWNRYGAAAGMAKGIKIHSLRVYSRALTADEIAHNYAVDKVRFNLPEVA